MIDPIKLFVLSGQFMLFNDIIKVIIYGCTAGLVTALTLMRLGHTADAAIDLIREKRSVYALFNEHFLAHLRQQAVTA